MREQVLKLRLRGLSYAAIARRYAVSRQYIQQILRPSAAVRALVQERAGDRCEHCRAPTHGSGHVHHKRTKGLKLVEHDAAINLAWLCRRCHRLVHREQHRAKNPDAVALGRLAAGKLTKQQRVERARHAAQARWAKKAP